MKGNEISANRLIPKVPPLKTNLIELYDCNLGIPEPRIVSLPGQSRALVA